VEGIGRAFSWMAGHAASPTMGPAWLPSSFIRLFAFIAGEKSKKGVRCWFYPLTEIPIKLYDHVAIVFIDIFF
jgi:hypothetical protein